MNRTELEHVIRAASTVADDPDIVVVGPAALLGTFAELPAGLPRAHAADVYPRNAPTRWSMIDAAPDDGEPSRDASGCFARGVDPAAVVLPEGWESRLVAVAGDAAAGDEARGATGWCLDPHDAVASHLVGGRDPEVAFAAGALRAGLVEQDLLADRIRSLDTDPVRRDHALSLLTLSAARSVLAAD